MKSSIFKLFTLFAFIGPVTAHAALMSNAVQNKPGSTECSKQVKELSALRKEFINPKIESSRSESLPARRSSVVEY